MKRFYVVKPEELENFGFVKTQDGRCFYKSHRSPCVWYDKNTKRLLVQAMTVEAIAVFCEMYKKGVFKILDDNVEPSYTMRVTEEEMKMIFEKRQKNERV